MLNTNFFKLSLFCLFLVLTRIICTGELSFLFLVWNAFLAWIPFCFVTQYKERSTTVAKVVTVGIGILFLPNAPYILTDLFHLSKNSVAPTWFDLVLLLSFATLGMGLFVLTVKQLLFIFARNPRNEWILKAFKALLCFLSGYGIYLGRYLRFNSWDLVTNPLHLFSEIANSWFNINCCEETCAVTFTFTIFLYLVLEITQPLKQASTLKNELS